MCIVSLIVKDNDNFILTHNRDENIHRPSSQKTIKQTISNTEIESPVDITSGGTWIYASDKFICCVLNGEFKKHKRNLPYKKSRGKIILETLEYDKIDDFLDKVDLVNIEAFTMFLIDLKNKTRKILVWDEKLKHIQDVTTEKLVVRSSSTLYSDEEKIQNYEALKALENKTPNELLKEHDRIKMPKNQKYPNIQTTSITQIEYKNGGYCMNFCRI